MPEWDGEERRTHFCPVHHIKCDEIHAQGLALEDLKRTKLSIKMFQIFVAIVLAVGGSYWYRMDKVANDQTVRLLEHQGRVTDALENHIATSNKILRRMSHDVRETRLNMTPIMKKLELEYQKIPSYYQDEPDEIN